MRGRWTAFALTLGLSAVPALVSAQDHAVPRGAGRRRGRLVERRRASLAAGPAARRAALVVLVVGWRLRRLRRPRSDAERRHPRPGTGTGDRYHNGRNSYYYGSPYYYGRQYYYNAYDPFFYGAYGYSPFYYSGAYGYAPYYYRGRYSDSGSLRVIVDPEQTRVYVDGYYAGIVDDFDGIFQRLSLPPGRHEISAQARRVPHAQVPRLRAGGPDAQDPPHHGARPRRGHGTR